ncbi:uncharacterized protein LOC143210619 [Lasioglossum baleicum]|uniref:uncharacterized protein LOC143210619 n=1 Tax=Lasioglossum baleicum TaxID=434251 RepID=UPI003FCDECFE
MTSRFLPVALLCAFFVVCPAKPTEVLTADGSSALNPLQQQLITAVETDVKRAQRSPQFGFAGEGGFAPFPEFDDDRRFENHHRHHHRHQRPEGCGEFGCGGEGFGPQPGFYPSGGSSESTAQASAGSNGFGGSVASANAESSGFNGPSGGGGGSQANAQSASFNFGPYSASFSIAESSSGAQQPPIF